MPHKDRVIGQTYNREYKRANRWRYRARQKSYDAAKHANLRAQGFGVSGTITAEEVEAVLSVGRCHHCGTTADSRGFEIDHLTPMDKGGPNVPTNLVCSCGPCNKSKFRSPTPWRWSREHDSCIECGTSAIPHLCHGRCNSCHSRFASRTRRALASARREGLSATGH